MKPGAAQKQSLKIKQLKPLLQVNSIKLPVFSTLDHGFGRVETEQIKEDKS